MQAYWLHESAVTVAVLDYSGCGYTPVYQVCVTTLACLLPVKASQDSGAHARYKSRPLQTLMQGWESVPVDCKSDQVLEKVLTDYYSTASLVASCESGLIAHCYMAGPAMCMT